MLKHYKNFSPKEKKLFNSELAILNAKIGSLIIPIIAFVEIAMMVAALITRKFESLRDFLYLWCYIILFCACFVYIVLLWFFRKRPERHINGMRFMAVFFSILTITWGVCISLLDSAEKNSPVVILTVFMALAGAVYMYPWESSVLFLVSFTVFCIVDYMVNTTQFYAGSFFNMLFFLLIAEIISFSKFESRVKDFLLTRALKDKNATLTDANERLKDLNEQLETISMTDRLTGLRNRWSFTDRMKEVYERCKKHQKIMSLAIFDLDDFKLVNDRYGHAVGDECLKETAEVLKFYVPSCDLFRYGGEEFITIFEGLTEKKVAKITGDIRAAMESRMHTEHGLTITVSGGQFSAIPSGDIDLESFLINADRALYSAKKAGKNDIVVYRIGESENVLETL